MNTEGQEPGRLAGHADEAVRFMRAEPLLPRGHGVETAAMGTIHAIEPAGGVQPFVGLALVMENGVRDGHGHGGCLLTALRSRSHRDL